MSGGSPNRCPSARRGRLMCVLLPLAVGAGCAGATFDGSVYRGEHVAFRIPPPPAQWRQLDHSHALAFRDDTNAATIMFGGRCGLDGDDIPLKALTNHLFLQFTDR
ncbi:MAG TPA: hypothetical protein ENK23_04850, partial [Sorangium sp.]|nr:hypothetical protein [Sorangium sp.]